MSINHQFFVCFSKRLPSPVINIPVKVIDSPSFVFHSDENMPKFWVWLSVTSHTVVPGSVHLNHSCNLAKLS